MNNESYYSDTRRWVSDENQVLVWAIFMALPVGILGFRFFMRGGPVLFFIVFGLLVFILYQVLDAVIPPALTKTFYVPRSDAEQVVENVLEEKNFPYEWRRNSFHLTDIQIKVKTRRRFGFSEDGCFIQITPNTPENDPLITSLCTKIDDAFAPKGLSS